MVMQQAASIGQAEPSGERAWVPLFWWGVPLALGSAAAFQVAFLVAPLCGLVVVSLGCLFALRRVATPRQAFYLGLLAGFGVYAPQMGFLWRIFHIAAIPLWIILSSFHGLFVLLLRGVDIRWGPRWALALAPALWCGIEYFRSEVWWLRFSWFSAGTCLPVEARGVLRIFGVYGAGALAMALGAIGCRWLEQGRPSLSRRELAGVLGTAVVLGASGIWPYVDGRREEDGGRAVQVAGVQMEFPGVPEVRMALKKLRRDHPDAELIQLSEYTFDGPVPEPVKDWCRQERVWLLAGGRELLPAVEGSAPPGERFRNTAFVIGPDGTVAFSQAKSRPIQFFRDGEPARERRVWDSPWGRLGIAICYDASYRRVLDDLVRQGAQALLVPTMDVEHWGEYQHRLNARMARLRSAEYGLPVFRVASSGISQLMDAGGRELATAPCPGPGAEIAGTLRLASARSWLPLDHWLAPACAWGLLGVIGALGFPGTWLRRGFRRRPRTLIPGTGLDRTLS
ncbi:MAG: hypothetical protein KIT22_02950 [Verrucomicrobiae bacterium]|nr:hypothetical protein [Verrucomicrobiae bacterium]